MNGRNFSELTDGAHYSKAVPAWNRSSRKPLENSENVLRLALSPLLFQIFSFCLVRLSGAISFASGNVVVFGVRLEEAKDSQNSFL